MQHNLGLYRLNDDIGNADWYLLTSYLQDNVATNDGVDGRRVYMQVPLNGNGAA